MVTGDDCRNKCYVARLWLRELTITINANTVMRFNQKVDVNYLMTIHYSKVSHIFKPKDKSL